MRRPDVAIVGGGLVGRCLAWRAARSGARVVLYDSASSRGINSAAWAAAGMIAPTTEAIDADVQIASMGNYSLRLWPQWLAELPMPVFYRNTGTILLWHGEDAGEAARAQSMLASRQAQSCVQCLETSQIAEVEPELGTRFSQALHVPGEAQIDNRGFLKAVGLALEEAGVECHWETTLEDGKLPDSGNYCGLPWHGCQGRFTQSSRCSWRDCASAGTRDRTKSHVAAFAPALPRIHSSSRRRKTSCGCHHH